MTPTFALVLSFLESCTCCTLHMFILHLTNWPSRLPNPSANDVGVLTLTRNWPRAGHVTLNVGLIIKASNERCIPTEFLAYTPPRCSATPTCER